MASTGNDSRAGNFHFPSRSTLHPALGPGGLPGWTTATTCLLVLAGLSDGNWGWEEPERRRGFSGPPPSGVVVGDLSHHPHPKQPSRSFPRSPQAAPSLRPGGGTRTPVASPAPALGGLHPRPPSWVPHIAKGPTHRSGMAFPKMYTDIWAHAQPSDENIRLLKRTVSCSRPLAQNVARHPAHRHLALNACPARSGGLLTAVALGHCPSAVKTLPN